MKQLYKTYRPRAAQAQVIEQANEIIEEYQEQGYQLTVRMLYYQFVARDMIPNTMASYNRLQAIVNKARLGGLIDWDAIVDLTRYIRGKPTWKNPLAAIKDRRDEYQLNPWEEQDYWPQVWIEKEALVGVVDPVCDKYRVPYFATRGYASQSTQREVALDLGYRRVKQKKIPIVFLLTDHDPSGLDMGRDNEDRLHMFGHGTSKIIRIALTMDQIETFDPPPNPAKETDTRFAGYRREYGEFSWELDALEPSYIEQLIGDHLDELIDKKRWKATMEREKHDLRKLGHVIENLDDVVKDVK